MIRELDAINALRAHIAEARKGLTADPVKSPGVFSAAVHAQGALVLLARELSKSSDMPAEFLRQVGVKP